MSILSLSSRIFRIRSIGPRFVHERPAVFKKKKDYNLIKNKYENESTENEGIDLMGYFLLTIPVTSLMLGIWQIDRRKSKLNLIEDLSRRMNTPPQPLPDNLNDLENLEYCPIKVRGEFLYDKEFKIGPRSLIAGGAGVTEKGGGIFTTGGSTGYCIITPFKLENRDETILINRGWIKASRGKIPESKLAHIPGIHEITGVVRLHEPRPVFTPKNTAGTWIHRDLKAMARMAETEEVFLDLIVSDGIPGGPIAGQTRVTMRNEHLSYIITWFGLSGITTWMWIRMYIQKLPLL